MDTPVKTYVTTQNKAKPIQVGLRSGTRAANNPTSDSNDGGDVVGASMYDDNKMFGTSLGQPTLEGAQGNKGKYC